MSLSGRSNSTQGPDGRTDEKRYEKVLLLWKLR